MLTATTLRTSLVLLICLTVAPTSMTSQGTTQNTAPIDCTAKTPTKDNGKISLDTNNSTTVGSNATVTCDPGYDANPSTISCKADGTWSTAKCDPKDCTAKTPTIYNGNISFDTNNSTTFGSMATVTCVPGYDANPSTISCQANGNWSTAKCDPKDCTAKTPTIDNGHISLDTNNSTTVGSNATVTCDHGYDANPSTISCKADGTWSTAKCDLKEIGYNGTCDNDGPDEQCNKTTNAKCIYSACKCEDTTHQYVDKYRGCVERPTLPTGGFNVTFEPNPDNNKSSFIVSWGKISSVYLTILPPTKTNITSFYVNSSSKTIIDVRSGTKYTVCVYTNNGGVHSYNCSSKSSFTVPEPVPKPSFPNINKNGIVVNWDSSRNCEKYNVTLSSLGSVIRNVIVPRENSISSNISFTNLTAAIEYTVLITAIAGQYSSTDNKRTSIYTRPPILANIASESSTVSLNLIMNYTGANEDIVKYCLYLPPTASLKNGKEDPDFTCAGPASFDESAISTCTPANQVTIIGLKSVTQYTFLVYTCLAPEGSEGLASEHLYSISVNTRPENSINLNVIEWEERSLNVRWSTDGRDVNVSLKIEPDGDSPLIFTETTGTYRFENLSPGKQYNISAYDVVGGFYSENASLYETYTKPSSTNITHVEKFENSLKLTVDINGFFNKLLIIINGKDTREYDDSAMGTDGEIIVRNLTAGTRYHITVVTIIKTNGHDLESSVKANISSFTLPAPPTRVEFPLHDIHEDSFTVNITGGPAVGAHDGYCVILTAGTDKHNCTNTSVITFRNLQPGTLYNMSMYSRWSGENGTTPLKASIYTRPTHPTYIEVKDIKEDGFTINVKDEMKWSHYSFLFTNGTEEANITVSKDDLPKTISELHYGTLFTVQAYSILAGLSSEHSTNVSTYTKPGRVDNVRSILENAIVSTIAIQWNPPEGHHSYFRYNATCTSPYVNSSLTRTSNTTNKTTAVLSNLDPGTNCSVTITVVIINVGTNEQLDGQPVTKAIDITRETAPGVPWNIRATSITSNSIRVTWEPPVERNGIVRNYTVKYAYAENNCYTKGSIQVKTVTTEDATNEITLVGPDIYPFWDYNITVYATNNVGDGNESTVIAVKTKESVPAQINTMTVILKTPFKANVTWSRPCKTHGIITSYTYELTNNSCIDHNLPIEEKHGCKISKNTESLVVMDTVDIFPFRNYSFTVAASNSAGTGIMSQPILISVVAAPPETPSNIIVSSIKSDTINASWSKPVLFYGPTMYEVEAIDLETFEIYHSTTSTAYWEYEIITSLNVEGLDAYWQYNVTVYAITGGVRRPSETKICTTAEARPGKVSQITLLVEKNVTKPRSITVNWKQPAERDKNGVITKYHISCINHNQRGLYNFTTHETQSQSFSHKFQNISPGNYTVKVYAETKVGTGIVSSLDLVVEPGAPLKVEESSEHPLMQKASQSASDKEKEIVVKLPLQSFLCNYSNGAITEWGLVVADAKVAKDNPFNGNKADFMARRQTYRKWSDIKDADTVQPYIATSEKWKPCESRIGTRRRRSTDNVDHTIFTVGEDGRCSGQCNGELKPDRSYKVKSFVCTSNGCTETLYSQAISTAPDLTAPIAAGVSSAVVVIAIVAVVVVFVLRRRRAVCFSKDVEDVAKHRTGNDIALDKVEPKKKHAFRPGPVKLAHFPNTVKQMHRNTNLLFADEYRLIKENSPQFPMTAAKQQCCRPKNRYTTILPFDQSRVKLRPSGDVEGSDYINANYIPGHHSRREYIATQGPLPATVEDFWRMVWEQNVDTIVMLTKLMEIGLNKCDKYWPDLSEPVFYGDLVVTLQSESNLSDYTIKIFEVKLKNELKMIRHFSYLKWPDKGYPETPQLLLDFVKAIRQYTDREKKQGRGGPTIVHCSAGVGRTGTLIAVDHLLQHIRDHDEVDIYSLVLEMRQHRLNMVQTEGQYVYIHECLKSFIMTDEDDEEDDEKPLYMNTAKQEENVYENTAFKMDNISV